MKRPPFYVEPADDADVERVERWRLEWLRDDPFLDALCAEFGFSDRDALAEALLHVEEEIVLFDDDREADTLDELGEPLAEVIRLVEDNRNAYRLWCELVKRCADAGRVDDEIAALPGRLREIAAAAEAAHRERAHRGTLKAIEKVGLRDLAQKLALFYESATVERWRYSQQGWAEGKGRANEPTSKAALFVYRVVNHFLPGREMETLRSALREVKSGRPLPGKRRGRPPKPK